MQELPAAAQAGANTEDALHLVVMANGLFGRSSNWDVIIEELQKHLDIRQTLLVASNANSLTQARLLHCSAACQQTKLTLP